MPDLPLDSSEQFEMFEDIAERVKALWGQALEDVIARYEEAKDELGDGYTVERLEAIEAELRSILAQYAATYNEMVQEAVEAEIERVNGDLDGFFEEADFLTGITAIDPNTINAIVSELQKGVDGTLDRAGRIGSLITEELRRMQLENLFLSEAEGEGIEDRKKRIIESIDKGIADLPEGWKGSVESYAEMVARTNMAEAARATTLARSLAVGVEVFQVSVHGATDACAAFEGRLYGKTGNEDGVSGTVRDILGMRPWIWHPNCRHQLLPWIDEIASSGRREAARIASEKAKATEEEMRKMNNDAAKLRRDQEDEGGPLIREAEEENAKERTAA